MLKLRDYLLTLHIILLYTEMSMQRPSMNASQQSSYMQSAQLRHKTSQLR